MRKAILSISLMLLCVSIAYAASPIRFSGGSTSIEKNGDELKVRMSGGASVDTDGLSLTADEVSIWGTDYRYVRCSGSVKAVRSAEQITILTPGLFYDRLEENLLIDSWIEIQDTANEVALSGAHLDYSLGTGVMKLQIQARILKQTDQGLLSCTSDSIVYDSKRQTLVLKGHANVTWGSDRYSAASITIDLNTNQLRMEGQITGTVNG